MGFKWENFIERYRNLILKIQKLRGIQKTTFEFNIEEGKIFLQYCIIGKFYVK